MDCTHYHERLQRVLDGDAVAESPAATRHLEECSRCRALQTMAIRLTRALNRRIIPAPTPTLAEKISRAVLRARRREVVYRTAAACAIAASVVLAVYVAFGPSRGIVAPESPSAPTISQTELGGASEFRANVEGAYGALATIVNHTAANALEPGRVLLPDRNSVAFLAETARLQPALAPQVPSFSGTGQGVTELIPVENLGRFFNYFRQDLPGMDSNGKSDM